MKFTSFFLLLILSASTFCLPQTNSKYKIAVTMDDFPLQRMGSYKDNSYEAVFNKIVASIKKEKIPVTGFVNEVNLYTDEKPDSRKIKLLENWLNAGLDLGNHTYTHKGANMVPAAEYEADIIKGEKILKELLAKKGTQLKYFRHPYLQTGLSLEVKGEINKFLKERGYTIAPVTLDNSEWIFGKAYETAYEKNDKEMAAKIGAEYISYMKKKIEYYEGRSQVLFGRNISHVLLIHGNRLNSEYFNELCKIFRDKNYEFVSLDEALKDEAYKSEDKFIRNAGISWIDRWALAKGMKRDFFAGDIACPPEIMKYAGVESE